MKIMNVLDDYSITADNKQIGFYWWHCSGWKWNGENRLRIFAQNSPFYLSARSTILNHAKTKSKQAKYQKTITNNKKKHTENLFTHNMVIATLS